MVNKESFEEFFYAPIPEAGRAFEEELRFFLFEKEELIYYKSSKALKRKKISPTLDLKEEKVLGKAFSDLVCVANRFQLHNDEYVKSESC